MTMQSSSRIARASRGKLPAVQDDPGMGLCHDGRVTMIVGFSWGGWVTGGTSRSAAATAGDVARGGLASAICVDRFKAAPNVAAKLVELKAIPDSYTRRQFVEAGGWATMPGQTTPDRLGLESCTTALATSS